MELNDATKRSYLMNDSCQHCYFIVQKCGIDHGCGNRDDVVAIPPKKDVVAVLST